MKNQTDNTESSIEHPVSSIVDLLLNALLSAYSPTGENIKMELKTTADIVEEMQNIADIEKNKIQTALEIAGFEIKHNDAGYFWAMYKK